MSIYKLLFIWDRLYIYYYLYGTGSKYIYQRVVAYGKEAKFNFSISPHTFRYSIATHLAEQGADVRMIQEFLRHDNPRTTTRYIAQGFKQLQSVHTETHPRSH